MMTQALEPQKETRHFRYISHLSYVFVVGGAHSVIGKVHPARIELATFGVLG